MANSRSKILIPMLALCVLAVSAYGQAVLSLGSNPTRVRAEGITETVGLITLTNTTTVAQAIAPGSTLNFSYDGTITNDPGVAILNTTVAGTAPDRNIYVSGGTGATPATTSSRQDGGGSLNQYLLGSTNATTGGCASATGTLNNAYGNAFCVGIQVSRSGNNLSLTMPNTFVNTSYTNGAGTTDCNQPGFANRFCLVPNSSLNIQGVRINVASLSSTLPPAAAFFVNALLTTTPANAISIPTGSSLVVVGRAQGSITASVPTTTQLAQCAIPATPTLSSTGSIASGGTGGVFTSTGNTDFTALTAAGAAALFNVDVAETFSTAFTAANSLALNSTLLVAANYGVNVQLWDEAGITPGGFGSTTTGSPVAATYLQLGFQGGASPVTRGFQVVLTFAGLPSGSVLVSRVGFFSGANTNSSGIAQGTDIQIEQPTSTGVNTSTTTFALYSASGGAATVSYEVASVGAIGPTTLDTVTIPFIITAPAGSIIPLGSLGTVQASVGPTSTSTGFSSTASTIRFLANNGVPSTAPAIGISVPCITNLLFPFVTNVTGSTFNTGFAISNTANDATFSQAKQVNTGETGGVTLYFFGVGAPTGGTAGIALPIPARSTGGFVQTSGVIAPGEHTVFALNNGSTTALAPGFQGYIVALCNFRWAHGLAEIFDGFGVGVANVGFSYLPLVLNGTTTNQARNCTAVSSTVPSNNSCLSGEVLAH